MISKDALSANDVLRLIADETTRSVRVPKALHDGYLRAAAVLTAIGDIGSLKPALSPWQQPREQVDTRFAATDALRDNLILASGRRFGGVVMPHPRRGGAL